MDLDLDDFCKAFIDSEVVQLPLESMGGKVIYIRALSRSDRVKFSNICKEINTRTAMHVILNPEDAAKQRETDLDNAEDYLLIRSMCDAEGRRQFETFKQYKEWSSKVSNEPVEEIIKGIKDNFIFNDIELKKKPN